MLKLIYQQRFKKELKKSKKRGNNIGKLKTIITSLLNEDHLPEKNCNHKLKGDFEGCWECHIEPDWLLIYKKTPTEIILVRTGTHADLFR